LSLFPDNVPYIEWLRSQTPAEPESNGGALVDLKRTPRVIRPATSQPEDRLPPNSPEAESGVLGCILLSPNECMGQCIEKLKAVGEEFYDLRHQTIFKVFLELYEERIPIDVITLQQRLKDKKLLEQVGGIGYLAGLPDAVPSAANLSYYLDFVYEKYLLRRLIYTCTDTVGKVYEYEGEVSELMDEVERDILRIGESRVSTQLMPIKELTDRALQNFDRAAKGEKEVMGLRTGFTDLDILTQGLRPGQVFVIAARPGIGKTSFAMNICEYVCCDLREAVCMFSLEMTADELTERAISSRARVNLRSLRRGFLAEREMPMLTTAASRIASSPLYIDDSSGLSILQLRAKARRYYQQYGLKLICIDYLQLLNATGGSRRPENRQQEISDISAGIKNLAKELKIPVIILSQLNRNVERDKNRKPQLSDLRESGAIEQDADIVGLLYKVGGQDDDEWAPTESINLLIAKQRSGQSGVDVNLTFLKTYTRFEAASRVSDDDVPNGNGSSSYSAPRTDSFL